MSCSNDFQKYRIAVIFYMAGVSLKIFILSLAQNVVNVLIQFWSTQVHVLKIKGLTQNTVIIKMIG